VATDTPLAPFSAPVRHWFERAFPAPTDVQASGWPAIADGRNALLLAPTGSGKTLAAFLWAINRVVSDGAQAQVGIQVVYVSPLKALVYDIERNLTAPLVGIQRSAERLDEDITLPRVDVRTGDTPQNERRRQARDPGEILVTTPESLYLLLGSKAAVHFQSVHTVIVDEVHALASTKRGAHLSLSLERLEQLTDVTPQRIGLSATVSPQEVAAHFLCGQRFVDVIDTTTPPNLDLAVVVPVPEMHRVAERPRERPSTLLAELSNPDGATMPRERGIWSVVVPALLEEIRGSRSTIVFVNSRGLAERLSQQLNELAEEELVWAHHGSVSHAQRRAIEEGLKQGEIRAIVATSTMELGIDMGAVELVVLVESPGSVARGLQRVGRAGHQVGAASVGRIYPKHRGDLLEAMVVAGRMRSATLEAISLPRNPLDVLAQQIVAMCCVAPMSRADIARTVRSAAPYNDLSDAGLDSVLEMLCGRYATVGQVELRPRLAWDRANDTLSARRGSAMVVRTNVGTIPDRGLYTVHVGPDGPKVGELDEEMVFESRAGEVFALGATSWRIEEITRDRVIVSPAPGEPGKLPFWHGDGPGRDPELGLAIGQTSRELLAMSRDAAADKIANEAIASQYAAGNLLDYLQEQQQHTGAVPTDRTIVVEKFPDELGDWRVCILTPMGARVHAPWAMALERRLGSRAGFEIQVMYADDGIVLRFADAEELPDMDDFFPEPEDVETLLVEQLPNTAMFAGLFRESAARALLLPRRTPTQRKPLWAQRMKSAELMAKVRQFGDFPIMLECYREALADQFDLDALRDVLRKVHSGQIRVHEAETSRASPFAKSLVFSYVAAYLYEQDAPLAERKAQALSLDRELLAELVGQAALRDLIDPDVLVEVHEHAQCLTASRQATDADELELVLQRLGDLSLQELCDRAAAELVQVESWLEQLRREARALEVRIAGEARWLAVQDLGLYRDALGVVPPAGLSEGLLAPVENALSVLTLRYARTRGPFTLREIAARFDLRGAQLEAPLALAVTSGQLVHGEISPRAGAPEWCDVDILRRLKRATLAKLRAQVAPVDASNLARFLPSWHGIGERGPAGIERVAEVIEQLEGVSLPWRVWHDAVLPARIPGFRLDDLERLCASGGVVWVGAGASGAKDLKVAFYLREHVPLLLPEPAETYVSGGEFADGEMATNEGSDPDSTGDPDYATAVAVLAQLREHGACFQTELELRLPGTASADVNVALRLLVRDGLVTNDTLAPLRHYGARSGGKGGRARSGFGRTGARMGSRRPSLVQGLSGGRWSALPLSATTDAGLATEAAVEWTQILLARYGIVTREMALAAEVPDGFKRVYPVLKRMEESGRVRRGFFVEGLSGAQFALPGVVDRLREEAEMGLRPSMHVRVLAASDPANPFGAVLRWPTIQGGAKLRRVSGAWVGLVDASLVFYYTASSRTLWTPINEATDERLGAALHALSRSDIGRKNRLLVVQTVNGVDARESAFADVLANVGFVRDYRGMSRARSPALEGTAG
tara:strand:+ start:3884 stop:8452 length:4569 start_codon:yes stop_codon:yes gene_type:complete